MTETAHPRPRRTRADDARRFADLLRQQIRADEFRDRGLPSEGDLVREFGISRNAVRDGLAQLKSEGLIDRAPRIGTHVTQRKVEHGIDRLVGLKQTLREYGTVRNEVRAAMEITPPPAVARRLELAAGERVVYIERVRYLGDLPLSLDLTYLEPGVGGQLLGCDLEHNDVFALIESVCGQSLGSAELAVEAVVADAHSAANLQTPEGAALLLLERLTRLSDGKPVDLEYIRMRGDRITLRGSLFRDPSGNTTVDDTTEWEFT
ncbi:GntR family transcriptional regulator [Rhodococcus triatomae]|uniref:GntR family transcriptional regulator n=1 Tax=Rhodococcus triatomae TaxID=300028 RepID=A0A1G8S7F8_9NOCA|nr:GntR family transcriptional regulator [Rhodococcus triatomae]QNG19008.1 GntR family transcriptional regulator [Rhodococcus triatomae]QNG25079.1 GntR family transcriptional regulator [Rhodococcus triatomae]SDJ25174.1 GntR family transcriptional regulator [Rhodococcus triatomae]